MTDKVLTERDGGVLVSIILNPPINAGSIEVRRGILAAISQLAGDSTLTAGVLIGGGNTFIAGSDLREFGRPLEEPQLPAVIAAIKACGKPVVAALHGAALGGGFELALGCDARVASAGTLVGLPEVTLGMIPGAGGTQRLPRIVGAAKAIPATRDAIKTGRGRPQVLAAIDIVMAARTLPIDAALQRERALFRRSRNASHPTPPPQIRTSGTTAFWSCRSNA